MEDSTGGNVSKPVSFDRPECAALIGPIDSMKSSREWAEELNAVFDKVLVGDTLLETVGLMMPVTQEFTEGVEKLRNTISSALKSELLLGERWKDDGDEILRVLSDFTRKEKATVAKHLEEDDGEPDSEDTWVEIIRKSEKGMRKLLRAVPIPLYPE